VVVGGVGVGGCEECYRKGAVIVPNRGTLKRELNGGKPKWCQAKVKLGRSGK